MKNVEWYSLYRISSINVSPGLPGGRNQCNVRIPNPVPPYGESGELPLHAIALQRTAIIQSVFMYDVCSDCSLCRPFDQQGQSIVRQTTTDDVIYWRLHTARWRFLITLRVTQLLGFWFMCYYITELEYRTLTVSTHWRRLHTNQKHVRVTYHVWSAANTASNQNCSIDSWNVVTEDRAK